MMSKEFKLWDDWLYDARLTTVIDCGHNKDGDWTVFISFQLADFDVQPQDPSLPVYKKFAKFKWWWVVEYYDWTEWRHKIDEILEALWYDEWDVLEFLLEKAWSFIKLNVSCNMYAGKVSALIEDSWHEEWSDPWVDWWVDIKTFKFTDETTLQDISDLWFDAKHVKKSVEYAELLEGDDSVEWLF